MMHAVWAVASLLAAGAGYLAGRRDGVLRCVKFLEDAHAVRRTVGLATHPPLDDVARRLRRLL